MSPYGYFCLIIINVYSTGCSPIQVKINMFATRIPYRDWVIRHTIKLGCFEVCRNGKRAKLSIDRTRANTLPNLLWMVHKMV